MKILNVKAVVFAIVACTRLVNAHAQQANEHPKKKSIAMLPAEIIYPEIKMEVFPNPARQTIHVTFKPEIGRRGFSISLYDLKGSVVFTCPWQGDKINLPVLESGEYILTARRKNEVYSQKLIVARE